MHLYYYLNEEGKRVYTLKKKDPEGKPTCSAHPGKSPDLEPINILPFTHIWPAARFSPDDKFSQQRYTLKKRYNLLPTQQEDLVL